ncbi:MAG: alpha/beta fold hydrolase [bacterium]|nr:alpha/beta fold hydrolase [bacterium]
MVKKYDEIKVKSADGVEIAFNEFYSGKKKVVIICHGIKQYKDSPIFIRIAREFEDNYDVINMDLRGHGQSEGRCTLTSLEVQDLKAVVDYARQRHKKVGVIGFSLGAATTILEAVHYKNINSIILVSPFTKIAQVNLRFWKKEAFLTMKEHLNDWNQKVKIGNVFLSKQNPIDVIDKISPTPVLFLHGTEDWVIDPSHSQELYEKANQPKKLIIFENAAHSEQLYKEFPKKFSEVCLKWLGKTM